VTRRQVVLTRQQVWAVYADHTVTKLTRGQVRCACGHECDAWSHDLHKRQMLRNEKERLAGVGA
jgi:hypothetical protein